MTKQASNQPATDDEQYARVDENGHLILPPELAARYGIKRGDRVRLSEVKNGLYLLRSATQLAKLYIEPTNRCNLNCRTCVRNTWDDAALGTMSDTVFDRIIEGLAEFDPPPRVFFGGLGEPLLHPRITDMVRRIRDLGSPVEIISNGVLLTPDLMEEMIDAGVEVIWVSIDGAHPESYTDVRLGAALPQVIKNLSYFRQAQFRQASPFSGLPQTQLGIVFVAMKRNIADLPAVCDLAWQLGARRFLVTNVLPYTAELCDEVLYWYRLGDIHILNPNHKRICQSLLPTNIHLPRIDINDVTDQPLRATIARRDINVTSTDNVFTGAQNRCPFIESGAAAIRWDGSFSPCLPLLHDCVAYLESRERFLHHWAVGNITERSLSELWNDPAHLDFRRRVEAFDFPPCLICGGCDFLDGNAEDCFNNTNPVCGGCLWAQGLIQCP